MQTLGVSDSTPQSDSRLKNIFWPTIRSGTDVDTLGSQGFWICVAIGVLSLASNLVIGNPIAGVCLLIYFYLGGVGVRERSCYAAVVVFVMYVANFALSPGILNFFACVLLLSVLRATFIASFWERKEAVTEMPVRFNETWKDKFVDQWPGQDVAEASLPLLRVLDWFSLPRHARPDHDPAPEPRDHPDAIRALTLCGSLHS